MSEIQLCEFCKNTGVHICPDVAELILIKCSNKFCPIIKLQADYDRLLKEADALRKQFHNYDDDEKIKTADNWDEFRKTIGAK